MRSPLPHLLAALLLFWAGAAAAGPPATTGGDLARRLQGQTLQARTLTPPWLRRPAVLEGVPLERLVTAGTGRLALRTRGGVQGMPLEEALRQDAFVVLRRDGAPLDADGPYWLVATDGAFAVQRLVDIEAERR
ncbi:MAG: hypothetical protein KDG89_03200 [Geminicoccaceae bacterium]|nr:hypothetical protein [Geminicoccaceae bacterium]